MFVYSLSLCTAVKSLCYFHIRCSITFLILIIRPRETACMPKVEHVYGNEQVRWSSHFVLLWHFQFFLFCDKKTDRNSSYCWRKTLSFFLTLISHFCFLHAEYLTQVDLEERRESQEMNARQEFDKGEGNNTRVPQLLEKLSRPGDIPLYYRGALESLSQAVNDCKCSFGRRFAHTVYVSPPLLNSNLLHWSTCCNVIV